MKRITVTDANIFIDLIQSALIDEFFKLDISVVTTQYVFKELYDDQQEILSEFQLKNKLEIIGLEFDSNLHFNKKLSDADQSILAIAHEKQAIVLSGESLMRKWCMQNNLEARGLLWVFDEMIEQNIITMDQAHFKLKLVLTFNTWLPISECNKRLKLWKK
ncbi:MAG: hypothetical protein P8M34_12885 [Saprospiraceae bacterium]|nr:hypothetical protein [Saprospiraceae bacterium]